jgi:hypothetical protein
MLVPQNYKPCGCLTAVLICANLRNLLSLVRNLGSDPGLASRGVDSLQRNNVIDCQIRLNVCVWLSAAG